MSNKITINLNHILEQGQLFGKECGKCEDVQQIILPDEFKGEYNGNYNEDYSVCYKLHLKIKDKCYTDLSMKYNDEQSKIDCLKIQKGIANGILEWRGEDEIAKGLFEDMDAENKEEPKSKFSVMVVTTRQ